MCISSAILCIGHSLRAKRVRSDTYANGENTVHGKGRYVVMTIEKYDALRELELAGAVREARADYQAGRIADTSIKGHIRRIQDEL